MTGYQDDAPRMGTAEVMALIRASNQKGFTGAAPRTPADAVFRPARLDAVKRVDPASGTVIDEMAETVEAEVLPPEPVVHEVVVEDAGQRLADARADGYAAGRADGAEQGRAEGYAQGRAEAEAMIAPARDAFVAAAAGLVAAGDPADGLAEVIAAAVRRLAAERAGQMIDALPASFAARIDALADRVAQGVRAVTLRLHPDDLAAITPHLAEFDVLSGAEVTPDDRLSRGDVEVRADGIRLADLLEAGA